MMCHLASFTVRPWNNKAFLKIISTEFPFSSVGYAIYPSYLSSESHSSGITLSSSDSSKFVSNRSVTKAKSSSCRNAPRCFPFSCSICSVISSFRLLSFAQWFCPHTKYHLIPLILFEIGLLPISLNLPFSLYSLPNCFMHNLVSHLTPPYCCPNSKYVLSPMWSELNGRNVRAAKCAQVVPVVLGLYLNLVSALSNGCLDVLGFLCSRAS